MAESQEEDSTPSSQHPRVREVFNYLPEWALGEEALSMQDVASSSNITLNSFAQLVTLRLNVERTLISLLDDEDQYLLAEATDPTNDTIRRFGAVSDNAEFSIPTTLCGQGLCHIALAHMPEGGILIVDDIHKDPNFAFHEVIKTKKDVNFYAACPITINGHRVGIICVMDAANRPTLKIEQQRFLSSISSAIAQHLELVRVKKTYTRTASIVSALDTVMRPGQMHSSSRKILQGSSQRTTTPLEEKTTDSTHIDDANTFENLIIPPKINSATNTAQIHPPTNFLEYAGSLLVDGFDADGVIFYDAGSRFYSSTISTDKAASVSSSRPPLPLHTSQEQVTRLTASSQAESSSCEILAFSKGTKRTDHSVCIGDLKEQDLRDLLELFPSGQIIYAGHPEPAFKDGNDNAGNQSNQNIDQSRVIKCLRQALPDAESIAFFPMWDHYRERWHAGGFLYSCDARRLVFTAEDFSFLQAFALVLAGELASRDRDRSHSQKETFISMISHELRTPLHGILSNADLMRDVGLTTFQTTLLDTISACGHSLMDIIDHLIDRSTMVANDENFKKHHQLYQQFRRPSLRRSKSYDNLEEVDLVVITEEVISALAVEMHLRSEARQGYEEALYTANSTEEQDLLPSDAVVIYDIHPQHNWRVHLRKGAYRRLLSNLTSNAIKFTRHGTIRISLQRNSPADGLLKCTVTLEVADTGEGISSDFMKHHLFQQFQQENSRTLGSGLGLFIVKSMAEELEGKIDIQSTKGDGTLVRFTFSCDLTKSDAENQRQIGKDYADPVLQEVKDSANDLVVCFVRSGSSERPADAKIGLDHSRESIANTCKSWFGAVVEETPKLKAGPKFINFVDESFLDSKFLPDALADMQNELSWSDSTGTHFSPIVFIGTVNFTAALQKQSKFEARENMFSITNPCGPHQLARVLASCLKLMMSKQEPSPGLPQLNKAMNELHVSDSKDSQSTDNKLTKATPQTLPLRLTASSAAKTIGRSMDIQDTMVPPISVSPWETKPHMLLVEDNAINMKVLERLCQRLSLPYRMSFNGLEAVKLFEAEPEKFDIIWMDIMMPVMDGLAATKQIRNIEQTSGRCGTKPKVRVVALTGLSGKDIENDITDVGFDAFWTKPVKLDVLKQEVEKWARHNS